MKAIVHERYGPPAKVLKLREIDEPTAADDDVLVEVHCAAVAKGDWLIIYSSVECGPSRARHEHRGVSAPVPTSSVFTVTLRDRLVGVL